GSISRSYFKTCDPKIRAFRCLQIIPDPFAISAKPFVPFDLHQHRAVMNLRQRRAVGANRPGAIDFVPGTLVTKHEQSWISRRELNVIVPIRSAQKRLNFASSRANSDESQRPSFRQPVLHHLAFAGIVVAASGRW